MGAHDTVDGVGEADLAHRHDPTRKRRRGQAGHAPQITGWIMRPDDKLTDDRVNLTHVLDRCATLRTAHQLVGEFARIARERHDHHIDAWITQAQTSGIPALRGFADDLIKDYDAVPPDSPWPRIARIRGSRGAARLTKELRGCAPGRTHRAEITDGDALGRNSSSRLTDRCGSNSTSVRDAGRCHARRVGLTASRSR